MSKRASSPFVIEKNSEGERTYDVYSRLLEDRIVFLGTEIDESVANSIIAQLLLLDQRDSHSDICLYINSPGGSVTSGLAIIDTINYLHCDVRTVCLGMAASMGAVLLSAGKKGKRTALPNCHVMIHQPRQHGSPGVQTVTEQEIDYKLSRAMKRQLNEILAKNTGKTYKQVHKDCENDKWFNAKSALEYGIIDEIIFKKPNE